jgi:hypothetical protein
MGISRFGMFELILVLLFTLATFPLGLTWCCCSPAGCYYYQDIFNTGFSAGTDVNTGSSIGWTEQAGSWDITTLSGTKYLTTASSNAQLISTSALAINDFGLEVKYNHVDLVANDKLRIFFNWVDSNNYYYVEINYHTTAASETAHFYKVVAGVTSGPLEETSTFSPVAIDAAASTVYLNISYTSSDTLIQANFYAGGSSWITLYDIPLASKKLGVGTGTINASSTLVIQEISIQRLSYSSPACLAAPIDCITGCQDRLLPDQVQIDLSSINLNHLEFSSYVCNDGLVCTVLILDRGDVTFQTPPVQITQYPCLYYYEEPTYVCDNGFGAGTPGNRYTLKFWVEIESYSSNLDFADAGDIDPPSLTNLTNIRMTCICRRVDLQYIGATRFYAGSNSPIGAWTKELTGYITHKKVAPVSTFDCETFAETLTWDATLAANSQGNWQTDIDTEAV